MPGPSPRAFAPLVAGAIALGAGCAGRLAVSPEAIEDAYVDKRSGKPARRVEVAPAARPPGTAPGSTAGSALNVSFHFQLPPAIRLFWLAASAGERLLPAPLGAPGQQRLQVVVDAIRFDGQRPGPLITMAANLDVTLEPGSTLIMEIVETPGNPASLTPRFRVEKPAPALPRPPSPARAPGPGPDLERARPLQQPAPRIPAEFGTGVRGTRYPVRVCINRDGWLDSIRFLEPTHPRLAASLADAFRDTRWDPYRVNNQAVPSCEVVEVQF